MRPPTCPKLRASTCWTAWGNAGARRRHAWSLTGTKTECRIWWRGGCCCAARSGRRGADIGRAYKTSYAGPERFTAFGGTFCKIERSAAPELYALALRFPEAFSRALRHAGYLLRGELKAALRGSGGLRASWPELSRMHQYRRMDMLKAGTWSRGRWHHGKRFQLKRRLGYRRVSGRERLMERWRGRTRDGSLRGRAAMGGRLVNAMRYKMMNAKRVDVGAVTPSAARFLEAVQAGRRGTDTRFQYTDSQPVTPAMRRAFWAAGVPLGKDTTTLEQPERPLVGPIYRQKMPEVERLMLERIRERLGL